MAESPVLESSSAGVVSIGVTVSMAGVVSMVTVSMAGVVSMVTVSMAGVVTDSWLVAEGCASAVSGWSG